MIEYHHEAAEGLIRCALARPELAVETPADWFTNPFQRELWQALPKLAEAGQTPDATTLAPHVQHLNEVMNVVVKLSTDVVPANAPAYRSALHEAWQRQRLADVATGVQQRVENGELTPAEVAGWIAEQMAQITAEDAASESEVATSWRPVDLAPYLDGTVAAPEASLMSRTDGVCLLYRGLTHSFHGESESGKSFIVQAVAAGLMNAGESVLYIDYESDPASITERFILLGCTRETVRERLIYVRPDVSTRSSTDALRAWRDLTAGSYALAVIDGVTESLVQEGGATKENDDNTAWARRVPGELTGTGAAVVQIDHVTKNAETRGRFAIGGQAKLAALSGAAYTVDVRRPLGRGLRGELHLLVGKDRPGYVRGHCAPAGKDNRAQLAAVVVVDSTGERPVVTINPPESANDRQSETFRPTALMEKVSRVLEGALEPLSTNATVSNVPGRREHIMRALNVLVEEGYAAMTAGPRSSSLYTSTRSYRQAEDPQSDQFTGGNQSATTSAFPNPSKAPTGSRSKDRGTGNQSGHPFDQFPGTSREPVGTSAVVPAMQAPEAA